MNDGSASLAHLATLLDQLGGSPGLFLRSGLRSLFTFIAASRVQAHHMKPMLKRRRLRVAHQAAHRHLFIVGVLYPLQLGAHVIAAFRNHWMMRRKPNLANRV